MDKTNSLPPKQIIDSFEGIVDHIMQYHLEDGMRQHFLDIEAGEDPDILTSESEPLYYFLLTGLLNNDGVSRHILKLIWRRLNIEHRD